MRKSTPKVQIVEVGLRDGLQSEKIAVSVADRIHLAKLLVKAGLPRVELGSFVREDWVPQMAGTSEIVKKMYRWRNQQSKKVGFSVLVPNQIGLQQAIESGVEEVALFGSCTESFSKANLNSSRKAAHDKFREVAELAHQHKLKVRGYLSVCFGCPFEGQVSVKQVLKSVEQMMQLNCYEISIGDTIGVASPGQVRVLFTELKKMAPLSFFAGHFHDTRGQALANVLSSYELGVQVFDASFGGVGGCPYAPQSTGNVATEELVYLFDGLGVKTGVDLKLLHRAGQFLSKSIRRPLPSRLWRASSNK